MAHQDLVVPLLEACQTLLRIVGLGLFSGGRVTAEETFPLRLLLAGVSVDAADTAPHAQSPCCLSACGPLTGTKRSQAYARAAARGGMSTVAPPLLKPMA